VAIRTSVACVTATTAARDHDRKFTESLDAVFESQRDANRSRAEYHLERVTTSPQLDLAPPNGRTAIEYCAAARTLAVNRRDRLGGLLHQHEREA